MVKDMPQENQVLRCFSCETFQVHIVKKSNKWECKICGAKQLFKKHYGRGTGKDCRNHVMKLNELRFANSSFENLAEDDITHEEISAEPEPVAAEKKSVSKWTKYLDDDEDEDTHCESNKKRRESERFDAHKESSGKGTDYQSSKLVSSKHLKYLELEGGGVEKKNPGNIFESSSDNMDELLNFI